MLPEPELEVIWDGTKDRAGTCPRLSGYDGGSTLTNPTPDRWSTHLTEAQKAAYGWPSSVRFALPNKRAKGAQ